MIKLIPIRANSDATYNYEVQYDGEFTLSSFIDEYINANIEEYGRFYVKIEGGYLRHFIEYKYGKITNIVDVDKSYLSKNIYKVFAIGSYGDIDFFIET